MKITGVYIPNHSSNGPVDVLIGDNNIIKSITPTSTLPQAPFLLLPTLCHPHIHLDKPYLLTSNLLQYADLAPLDGSFSEALRNTSLAKCRYTDPDLLLRGSQLILESVCAGVTSMRAFVEIDHVTRHRCLAVGKQLKEKYAAICHLQLCAFAQDPVFSSEHGETNRQLMEEGLDAYADVVEALGSTPYVEDSPEATHHNIEWAITTAIKRKLHLDFHLDYDLSPTQPATIWEVIRLLNLHSWNVANPSKTIAIGHCTRLTLFTHTELALLASKVHESALPISFIGLPTSDLYMMGRPSPSPSESPQPHLRPRGTLNIPSLVTDYALSAAVGINNVGNAFTPFGSTDPLRVACMGVGIYQVGTERGAEILYEAVSRGARRAIGLEAEGEGVGVEIREGQSGKYGFLAIRNEEVVRVLGMEVEARQRSCVRDVVWEVPELGCREVIGFGKSGEREKVEEG